MKKYFTTYRVLLFIVNGISMILELVAARILSPYFGSSNAVWTIIISMMLLANAFGNYYGGKLADKYSEKNLSLVILLLSGVAVSIIAILNMFISKNTGAVFSDSQAFIITTIVIAFMVPCVLIGMESPVINKIELSGQENVGKISGVIYMIITAGSLFGTLLGGVILIPLMGCKAILAILACSLYAFSIYLCTQKTEKYKYRIIIAAGCVILGLSTIVGIKAFDNQASEKEVAVIDTGESYVRIYNDEIDGENIRIMSMSGGFSSACYTDPEKRNELVFDYTKAYNKVLKMADFKTFLMIGGAGYSYPRYLISHYDDKSMDVVEIDGGITEVAKEYFYLQDFIDEYGTDRMSLITDDGRLYLNNVDKTYDVILNDSFIGEVPARSMATKEAVFAIKKRLNKGGVYATNLIGGFSGKRHKFFRSEIKTISSVFDHVWVINAKEDGSSGNYIVIASDTDYGIDSEKYDLNEEDNIYTDDFAPVEIKSLF